MICFLINTLYFLEQTPVYRKIGHKIQSSHMSSVFQPPHITSPVINIGVLVIIAEPMSIRWYALVYTATTQSSRLTQLTFCGPDNCVMACVCRHSLTQSRLPALKATCAPPAHPSPPRPLATTHPFFISTVLPFPECHKVVIIQYVAFPTGIFYLEAHTQGLSMSFQGGSEGKHYACLFRA